MTKMPVNIKHEINKPRDVEKTDDRVSVSPPVDIYEEKDKIVMLIDMPGVPKDQIQIRVDNGLIYISGESKVPEGGDLRYLEFSPRKYYRVFELSSEIDREKISAEYVQGVLNIQLSKQERKEPKQITINVK